MHIASDNFGGQWNLGKKNKFGGSCLRYYANCKMIAVNNGVRYFFPGERTNLEELPSGPPWLRACYNASFIYILHRICHRC